MAEDVLFESESSQSREEIAMYLHTVAEKLENGETITLTSGDESIRMAPPSHPTFEVKAESEGPTDGPKELSIEFELEWDEDTIDDNADTGRLEIE